jgi:hypothetical protein
MEKSVNEIKYCYETKVTFDYKIQISPTKQSFEEIFKDQVWEDLKLYLTDLIEESKITDIDSNSILKNKIDITTTQINIIPECEKLEFVIKISDLYKIKKTTKESDAYKSFMKSDKITNQINKSILRTNFYDKRFKPVLTYGYPTSSICSYIGN